jgi:predicted RNase H-like nuclease (RuvC/YqgF family)
MMKGSEASARPPKVAEAIDLNKDSSTSENINLAAKGGSPPLSLMERVRQLEATIHRLERELSELKKDQDGIWDNTDTLFGNCERLAVAIKTRLQVPKPGPKTEGRLQRLRSRLKQSGNLWIAKADLARSYELKRSTFHWFYLLLKATGEFETKKTAGRVYIRLAKTVP